MTFMLNNAGALAMASVPDVCKTPSPAGPVPMPYPNIATTQMADPAQISRKVLVCGLPALHQASKIVMSQGDEAGCAGGGVVSSTLMGSVCFLNGSFKVMVEGKPAVRLGTLTGHNGCPQNTVGTVSAPPPGQCKVMVLS